MAFWFNILAGRDGPRGIPGEVGDPGPSGIPGSASPNPGFLIARHSQTTSYPTCPDGTSEVWTGYSFLYMIGNENGFGQDLGKSRTFGILLTSAFIKRWITFLQYLMDRHYI